jgi:hypothetical protein
MSDRNEGAAWSPLTAEQWRTVEKSDHRSLFSREEVESALTMFVPAEEIPAVLDELYAETPDEPGSIFFFGDLLTALSLLSPSAADRASSLLNESPAEASARIAEFRQRWPGA